MQRQLKWNFGVSINRSPAYFFLFQDYKFLDRHKSYYFRTDATMWVDNVDAVRVGILLILLSEEV